MPSTLPLRPILWALVIVLTIAGHFTGDIRVTFAIVPVVGLALWLTIERSLRVALVLAGALLTAAVVFGGAELAVDLLPVVIAALVGWLFARTLGSKRQPLIARAIAVIDGAAPLAEPAVARYARRLTALWAVLEFALALVGLACVAHTRGLWPQFDLPSPAQFGLILLPGMVALLLGVEFALRPRLLPQVPQRSFPRFVVALVRAWPQLIEP